MKGRISRMCAVALAAVASGCAGMKAEDVRIYSPAGLVRDRYQTVARLWVETWRTPFWMPSFSSRDDGIAALKDKAAGLGANGLINVACYGDSGVFSIGSESYTCYGKAIKVPQ